MNTYNGEVTVKLSINNGKICAVSCDNGVQRVSSMLEEFLENCCVSADN